MTREQKILLLGFIAGLVIPLIALAIVYAEPGFHYITENFEAKQETYKVVIGTTEVPVLDENGDPTGKTITRPITKDETHYWTDKTITQGGTGVMFTDFGSGVTSGFLGLGIRELIINKHTDIARNFVDVTYLSTDLDEEGRRIVKRIPLRKWIVLGKPVHLEVNPRYHYSETPTVTLTDNELQILWN